MATLKGSSFEREICKSLSLWFSEGASDAIFWRSSQSGGRAKTRSKSGKKTFGSYGDIAAIHPSGLALTQTAILECKRGYKQWSPFDVLDAKPRGRSTQVARQTFELFVIQMNEDKEISGIPYSMLLYRRDTRSNGVAIETPLYRDMKSYCGRFNHGYIRYMIGCDYIFMKLEHFFDWANPEYFKQRYQE